MGRSQLINNPLISLLHNLLTNSHPHRISHPRIAMEATATLSSLSQIIPLQTVSPRYPHAEWTKPTSNLITPTTSPRHLTVLNCVSITISWAFGTTPVARRRR